MEPINLSDSILIAIEITRIALHASERKARWRRLSIFGDNTNPIGVNEPDKMRIVRLHVGTASGDSPTAICTLFFKDGGWRNGFVELIEHGDSKTPYSKFDWQVADDQIALQKAA